MRKVYVANSVIAFTLTVRGERRRVSFERLSNDTSYFTTNDTELQTALEAFSDFNKTYRLENFEEPKKEEAPQPKLKNITFGSAVSARDYLMTNYNETVSATKSVAKIQEVGKSHGLNIIIE